MADVLDFEVRIKTAEEDINKLNAQLRAIANNAENAGGRMDDVFSKVGKTIGTVFATSQLIDFGKQVVNVRKEIEAYEISFRTLLGSQDKADALFGSLREFAVKTPMQLGDLAKGAQTLLGFGIEADKIMPTLKQIGDISMGNAEKFGSLTLAFAQMSSTGKLMGQDLLQMINAGFNPLSIIAQKTGKSIGELKKEMEQGAISTEMVADAFKTATSEGGMFYGMLEKQGEGLAGAIAQLQGAWEEALNNIGTRSQEMVVTGIKGATTLVENYDKLISVILGLVGAYGTYKAALMATVAIDQAKMFADNIRLIAMFRKELGLLKAAQQAFNLTAMKNPYILLASAIVGVGVALYSFINRTDKATKAQEEFNKAVGERSSENISKIEKMSKAWNEMGDDIKAKEQYIQDNKTAFEELGVAINSVAEAEDLLVKNKDKFIEAQVAKAKAALYQEQANELIAKQVENEQKIENLKANPYTKTVEGNKAVAAGIGGGLGGGVIYNLETVVDEERTQAEIKKLLDENAKLQEDIDKALGKSITDISTGQAGEGKPIQNITEEIKKYQAELKKAKQLLDDLRSGKAKSTDLTGDIDKTEKRIKELQDILDKLIGVKTTGGSSDKSATTFAKDAEEEAQRMKDENFKNQLRHEAELAKIRGNNLEEYYNKQQELIDKEYHDKLRNIESERKEALKNANKESRKKINDAYDKQVIEAAEEYGLKTEKNNQQREAAIYRQRLETYRQFAEEYVRIEQERVEREAQINKLAQEGKITQDEANQRLETSTNVALVEKTTLQAEMGLTAEEVSSIIGEVVSSTVLMSIDQIRSELPVLEAELKALKDAGADPAKIANLTRQIAIMKNELQKAKKGVTEVNEKTTDGAKESKGDWKIVSQALGTVNDAISEVNNAFGDMFGEAGKTAMDIMQTTLNATMGILGAITATSEGASASIKAAESASVILAIISAAIQVITAITNAILKNFSAQAMYEKSMEEYNAQLDEIDAKWKRIEFENSKKSGVDYWMALVDSASQYSEKLSNLNSQLEETKKRQEDINKQQKFDAAARNSFGLKSEEELEKEAEEKRTKKEKELEETESEIEAAILEEEKALYELQQQILEEMATTNVEQFGETMAESIVEGFSNGMEGMKTNFDDTVNDLIKSMLTKRLALQLTDQFEDAFSYLEEATKKSDQDKAMERIAKMQGFEYEGQSALIDDQEMATFLEKISSAKEGALALSEEYQKLFAEMGLLDDEINSESKGFQTMSQDTADSLDGRFTALQISGANIEVKLGEQLQLDKEALLLSQSIRDNIELSTQIATQQLQELRAIKDNTAQLAETNMRLKNIQDNTSRL